MKLSPYPVIVSVVLFAASASLRAQVSERAQRLHDDALIFDAHVHIINRQLYQGSSIGDRYTDGHVDLPRLEEGGVDALFFSLYTTEKYFPNRYETRLALRLMDRARRRKS